MADHYSAALGHRATAVEAREQLRRLHESRSGDDAAGRRLVAANYDQVRHSLKLAEIDALLSIGQGLRDVVSAIEGRR